MTSFLPKITKADVQREAARLPKGDISTALADGYEPSLDELRNELHQLELGYGWNTINTPSRVRHVESLRRSVAELEAKERAQKKKGLSE